MFIARFFAAAEPRRVSVIRARELLIKYIMAKGGGGCISQRTTRAIGLKFGTWVPPWSVRKQKIFGGDRLTFDPEMTHVSYKSAVSRLCVVLGGSIMGFPESWR